MRCYGVLVSLALVACGPRVEVEDDGMADGDGSGADGSDGSDAGDGSDDDPDPDPNPDPPPPDPDPPVPDPPPPGPDPVPTLASFFFDNGDEIQLSLSTYVGAACPDPTPSFECAPFAQWSLELVLPVPVKPGKYALESFEGFSSQTGPDEGGGSCSGGAGDIFGEGLLVIESANDDVIEGLLVEADVSFNVDPVTEAFVASRCEL